MKLEKKHWVIIGVVIALILVWYFFLRKKKTESSWNPALGIKPIPVEPIGPAPAPGNPTLPSNPPLVQCAPCKTIDSYCFPQALAKYKADLVSPNIKIVQSADWNFKGNLLRCLNCIS